MPANAFAKSLIELAFEQKTTRHDFKEEVSESGLAQSVSSIWNIELFENKCLAQISSWINVSLIPCAREVASSKCRDFQSPTSRGIHKLTGTPLVIQIISMFQKDFSVDARKWMHQITKNAAQMFN